MRFVTVAGPPSAGKTSVILATIDHLRSKGLKVGVIKFDCLSTSDASVYRRHDVTVQVGLAGSLCPDHFFITNVEEALQWGRKQGFDLLISESAGLCSRCSPHVRHVLAVCVIDNLSGINTPDKIGPMLRFADVIAVTKGDIVSQAEREVFYDRINKVNRLARVMPVNGITGQGAFALSRVFAEQPDTDTLIGNFLRFSMPSALCSYCIGQTKIDESFASGNLRRIRFVER
ncbi:GTP-binding protein [Propionibacterium sp.]|uniref:GTP-binding protein n=1 Tax=Propionibacterium sp. TaxID=1977903 RepID=UPI0039EA5346